MLSRARAACPAVFAPLKRFMTRPAMSVGILGIGGLGHLAVQFAAAMWVPQAPHLCRASLTAALHACTVARTSAA